MRTLLIILATCFVFSGCQLISDIFDDEDECPSASILYGISQVDNDFHFANVNGQTGELKLLNKLSEINAIRGKAAINPELMHYYLTSEEDFFAIDINTGIIVNRFPLQYPNTSNMQYNANTKKLNAISFFDGQLHFSEIDVDHGSMKLVAPLSLKSIHDNSGSIDTKNNKFYLTSYGIIHTLDLTNGDRIDSVATGKNMGGLCFMEKDGLVGFNFSTMHFSKFDLKKDAIIDLHAIDTSITGMASLDIEVGLYYHFSGATGLSCIDARTGKTIASFTLPYTTNYLIPL
jgi:hypothetical protein